MAILVKVKRKSIGNEEEIALPDLLGRLDLPAYTGRVPGVRAVDFRRHFTKRSPTPNSFI